MGKVYRGSLALRVLAISIVIFALPLLIYFLVVIHGNYTNRLRDTATRLIDLGKNRVAFFEGEFNYAIRTIDILHEIIGDLDPSPEELNQVMTSVVEGGRFSVAFLVIEQEDSTWICTASSDPNLVGDDLTEFHFIEKVAVHGASAFLAVSREELERSLYVVKQVDIGGGKGNAVLGIATDAAWLIDELVRTEDTEYRVNVSLLDHQVVLASGDPDLLLNFFYTPDQAAYVPDDAQADAILLSPIKGVKGASSVVIDGKKSLGVILPLPRTHMQVLLDASEKEVFGRQANRLLHVLALFFLLFVLGGWLALWVTQRMSVPWKKLGHVMERVSEGDLTARFERDKMGFEINDLGGIFNETIDSLCDQMAQAEVERVQKETLRQELNIGYEIQLAILPAIEDSYPGADIAARYIPAKEVGGDFYDVLVKGEDQLVLTVADAAGKGISACLYALGLRSMLRSACTANDDLATIMALTNNLFCKDTVETGMFVTVFTAVFDAKSKQLTYASCGHNPGLLVRRDGTLEVLESRGMAMGVQLIDSVDVKSVQLESGDLIVLYTDGVTEAHNEREELFSEERLIAFVKEQHGKGADEVGDALVARLEDYRGAAAPFDDITSLIIRVK